MDQSRLDFEFQSAVDVRKITRSLQAHVEYFGACSNFDHVVQLHWLTRQQQTACHDGFM